MPPNARRVFYVNQPSHPVFIETLSRQPDILLDHLTNDSDPATQDQVLSRAHVYQIGATRDELAHTACALRLPRAHAKSNRGLL